ncbi:MAG: GNAT family N-acetyltransferase/peptidase C39 family protein [Gammaproteobacteria bacterium]|nr:GNAT family N-acetyltransferase/peptidase C39 family protein [Gammaproteobacteria bacterium]
MNCSLHAPQIRPAEVADIPALLELEEVCFEHDRISKRQFRYLITKARSAVILVEQDGRIQGDVVVLFSQATSVARLYSIAVAPEARGAGTGSLLVKAAENAAWERHRAYMRLEVRKDNTASIALFTRLGYRRFGEWLDYYEDHMDAWRFEKTLASGLTTKLRELPYYEQTLEFTCGPAALMMAMKALDDSIVLNRTLELRLWREATTIYMTSGHGGCGPFGLALAAARRDFLVEVFVNEPGVHLIDSVRSQDKKEVIRLVQEDMEQELASLAVPISHEILATEELETKFEQGGMPLVLISSWQIYGEKFPHWVAITGFDDYFVYVHDPFIDYDKGETVVDSFNMPIPRENFSRMSRYGKAKLQAAIILWPKNAKVPDIEAE